MFIAFREVFALTCDLRAPTSKPDKGSEALSNGTASGDSARRRLMAIMAADVAGFSRLMGLDERATLASLDACRAVFREETAARGGRVVDTAGDSVLAAFDSVVEAVTCAVAVQEQLVSRADSEPEDRRMRFRVGVNLGDVLVKDDGTIYGDGVNVAARLEALAEPGGLVISAGARDQIQGKIELSFADIGEHEVKNIARPVRAFRLVDEARAVQPAPEETSRPSIAVLAFDNLSGDADQEFFADGIAEDLITELSRLRWLLVTARNSSFTFKGHAADIRQIGRDLGVRYVVEGSFRKGGNRIRITAQLIEAASGNHVWAERYDRDVSDIFALQDEITETLVAALQAEVGEFERERARRKPPESLDAWEFYQRGLWHLWRYNAEDMAEARRLLERATDLDANFAQAFAALGFTLYLQVVFSYADSPLENIKCALRSAIRAVSLDDKEAMAHFTLGRVRILRGEYDAAIAQLETAVDLNPSSALAHFGLAIVFGKTGQLEQAIAKCDAAIRLSPRDPSLWVFYYSRAMSHLMLGDYQAAVADSRRAIRQPTALYWPHAVLASALALLDRPEEAKNALDMLREVKPDFSPEAMLAALSPLNPGDQEPLYKTWFDGLRKAGLDIPPELTADR